MKTHNMIHFLRNVADLLGLLQFYGYVMTILSFSAPLAFPGNSVSP